MRALLFCLVALLCGCGAAPASEVSPEAHMSFSFANDVLVLLSTNQSNGLHLGRGEVGTLAAVRYAYNSYQRPADESSGGAFVDLIGNTTKTGGADFTTGRILHNAGVQNLAMGNLTDGSSFANQWIPTHANFIAELLVFDTIMGNLQAQFPTKDPSQFWFIHDRDQGTEDMRVVGNLAYQQTWASLVDQCHNALASHIVSAGFPNGASMPKFATMSYTGLSLAVNTPVIERQQLLWVGGTPDPDTSQIGPDHPRLQRMENAVLFDGDGVHMTPDPITVSGMPFSGDYPAGGYQYKGTVKAAAILDYLGTPPPSTALPCYSMPCMYAGG